MKYYYGDILTPTKIMIITAPCSSKEDAEKALKEFWQDLRNTNLDLYLALYGKPYGVCSLPERITFSAHVLGKAIPIDAAGVQLYESFY